MPLSVEELRNHVNSMLVPAVPTPVRERVAFWCHCNSNILGEVQTQMLELVMGQLNGMFAKPTSANVGQAIAYVEACQASQVNLERALFLSDPGLNPYATPR